MNTEEMSNRFDLLLNQRFQDKSILIIDEFEKSQFLTKAQESLVIDLYNKYDSDEFSRRALNPLVRTIKVLGSEMSDATNSVAEELFNAVTFPIDEEILFITNEHILVGDKHVNVKPVKIDYFNILKKNPFRKPNRDKCWRTETSDSSTPTDINNRDSFLELITSYELADISHYICTCVTYPAPIVLTDIGDLEIKGYSSISEASLNNITHETIVDIAVGLATKALYGAQNK